MKEEVFFVPVPELVENHHPIGVFDSGVGGLTVLSELIHLLPNENFVYFGDTARLPYGEKSRETIIRYSIESAVFLMEKNIKMLVVACNTATAHALERLQQIFNIPIIGVIQPCVDHAVEVSKNGRIAILGTRGTIRSESHKKAIQRQLPHAHVLSVACPLFVPIVEEHYQHHPAARLIVEDHLQPLKKAEIDTVVLGCTHYPLLEELIRQEIGEHISIVNPSLSCAQHVKKCLSNLSLQISPQNISKIEYYVSDDPQKFQKTGQSFLNLPINKVCLNII